MFENLYQKVLKQLPVNAVADQIIANRKSQLPILSSPTGSGKTLIIPARIADQLPPDERVVVLVPRKFLAIQAAETVAELSKTTLGQEVGYAVGTQNGDAPLFNKNSKIIFATYGYAISSGMISYEKNIVLDEVHEAALDISIVKALLHNRKKTDNNLNIIEMSATINLDKQKEYWKDFNPLAVECEGKTFDCKIIEDGSLTSAEHVVSLLKDHHKKGIAVFESGISDIRETEAEIKELLKKENITNIEVATIYGDMDKPERDHALKAPAQGQRKVLIGTNVIESGMNIPWLDAGVSSGKGKDLNVTPNGAVVLSEQHLPQWRLQQQKGRVCRFTKGTFILASHQKWEKRPLETTAEISRLPLTELVMACSNFGLKAEELTFDAPIDAKQLQAARTKLKRLKLIDDNERLTKLGQFAYNLPVTVENAVALSQARKEHCLPEAVLMVGLMEQGNLKQDFRSPHGLNHSSDIFDTMLAFVAMDKKLEEIREMKLSPKAIAAIKEGAFEQFNINKKRFYEAKEAIKDLAKRLDSYVNTKEDKFDFDKLKQCLLTGHISKLYVNSTNIFNDDDSQISNSSATYSYRSSPRTYLAETKVITPKNGRCPFCINENVTEITNDDLVKFALNNSDIITIDDYDNIKLADSNYFSHEPILETFEEMYRVRIAQAKTIFEKDGQKGLNTYLQNNHIPQKVWEKEFASTVKHIRIDKALNLEPQIPELFNALNLQMPQEIGNPIRINQRDLTSRGFMLTGKTELIINNKLPIVFEIEAPDADLKITAANNKKITFQFSSLNSLQIDSIAEQPLQEVSISDHTNINNFNLSDVRIQEANIHHAKLNNMKINNSQIDDFRINTIEIGRGSFDNSVINNFTLFYLTAQELLSFKQTQITGNFNSGGIEVHDEYTDYTLDSKGQIQQSRYDLDQVERTFSTIKQQISSLSNPSEEVIAQWSESDMFSAEQKDQLTAIYNNRVKALELQARKEAYQAMLEQKRPLLEQYVDKFTVEQMSILSNKLNQTEGLEINAEDLVAVKNQLEQKRNEEKARKLAEKEAKKQLAQNKEKLCKIYYDTIADEITNTNGEVCRDAGSSKASHYRLINQIYEDAQYDEIPDWDKINITNQPCEEDEELFMHNVRYIEKNCVLPDIERNDGIYDPDYCYYEDPESMKAQEEAFKAQQAQKHNLSSEDTISKEALEALAARWGR